MIIKHPARRMRFRAFIYMTLIIASKLHLSTVRQASGVKAYSKRRAGAALNMRVDQAARRAFLH